MMAGVGEIPSPAKREGSEKQATFKGDKRRAEGCAGLPSASMRNPQPACGLSYTCHRDGPVDGAGTGDEERAEMGLVILIILLLLLFGGGGYGYSRYGYGGGIGIGGILLIVLIVYLLFGYSRF